jgi:outer membrane protein
LEQLSQLLEFSGKTVFLPRPLSIELEYFKFLMGKPLKKTTTMKNWMHAGGLVIIALLMTVAVQAQKFGYINSSALLVDLPEVKQAESDLEAFSKQLQKKGQDMVTKFQTDVQAFQKKVEAGELSPKLQDEEEKRLEAVRAELGKYEQDMTTQIQTKRETLLKPIYDKVNDAIKAVATEGGYQYVFDQGVLLYFEPSADISAAVKKKLGI